MKPKTTKLLRTLAADLAQESGMDSSPSGLWRVIARQGQLSSLGSERASLANGQSIRLSQGLSNLYFATMHELENEPECEHFSNSRRTKKELDDRLWALVCEVALDQRRFRDAGERNKLIQQFCRDVSRPHHDFEVLFPIEHLQSSTSGFSVGKVDFARFDERLSLEWGIREFFDDALVGKTVARIVASAGSTRRAIERASQEIDIALCFLRVAGASVGCLQDVQLKMCRGKHHVLRDLADIEGSLSGGWASGNAPIDVQFWGSTLESVSAVLGKLEPLIRRDVSSGIGDRLVRAVEWVGSSITRDSDDDRIVDLCTALEAILCTKSDQLKGESLSVRVLLLAMAANSWPLNLHPIEVLQLYSLRSDVVHGSQRNIRTDRQYYLLRDVVVKCIGDAMTMAVQNSDLTSVAKLVKNLEQDEILAKAIEWLEGSIQGSSVEAGEIGSLVSYCEQRRERQRKVDPDL